MSESQHDDKSPRRRTRRPASLSGTLIELRDQKRRALATRRERIERLHTELRELTGQARAIEAEIERLTLAIGDARDTEREDVSAGGMDLSGPPADPDARVAATGHGSSVDGTLAVASLPVNGAGQ